METLNIVSIEHYVAKIYVVLLTKNAVLEFLLVSFGLGLF